MLWKFRKMMAFSDVCRIRNSQIELLGPMSLELTLSDKDICFYLSIPIKMFGICFQNDK